jgi:cation:H+ antiporter
MFIIWLKFLICAGIILIAGSQLSRYADIIAEKTGLTRAWIGLVLLASITSIPELANGISAVTGVGMPDLAIGDVFGACLYNMLTLSFLLISWNLIKRESIYLKISSGHTLSALFAIILIVIACVGVVASRFFPLPSFFGIGIFPIIIALVYLFAQRSIFLYESQAEEVGAEEEKIFGKTTLGNAVLKFLFFSAFVVAAGVWLPYIGNDIVNVMGWTGSFVGSIFLGLATTLPELTVSISAAFLFGSADLAIGNLFGSNVFNVFMLFVFELFFVKGPLLAHVSISNVFFGAVVISAIALGMLSLIFKPKPKVFGVFSWDSVGIIALYLSGVVLLFYIGAM